jgi:glycosyltransferase involved in cell wall biosynthesis
MATITAHSDRFDALPGQPVSSLEVSVVIPCLNEVETVGTCVRKALTALAEAGIAGEVLVADNGSTDGSIALATSLGAHVVHITRRGYGSALMGGITAARGRYILMGDADDSYDFADIPRFITQLRQGYDIVQGCRLPAGGGDIAAGAMPLSHRLIGNPLFSLLTRWWFHAPIDDVYCGMRAFKRDWWVGLDQRCTGMEFATEMILKGARFNARFAQVPITLHKDGRINRSPHLKTFRDGWRTLRFFLMYAPRWLFLEPGRILMALGLMTYLLVLLNFKLGRVEPSLNTLVVGSLFLLCGFQSIVFAIGVKTFAVREKFVPEDARLARFFRRWTLERGMIIGFGATLAGLAMIGMVFIQWWQIDFGHLDPNATGRLVIPGATLAALGCQTILSSFFISIIGLFRK